MEKTVSVSLYNPKTRGSSKATVCPKGKFPVRCSRCGHRLHDAETYAYIREGGPASARCNHCGERGHWNTQIRDSHLKYLSEDACRNTLWYHASLNPVPTWDTFIYTHFGTLSSAKRRLSDKIYDGMKGGIEPTMYVFRIRPEAKFYKRIEQDTEIFDQYGPNKRRDIHRYLNTWECPGSISIYATVDNMELVATRKLTYTMFKALGYSDIRIKK